MALAAGTRLGRYEIVGLLGAGGMGEVYRARDERLHREVALKVLHPGPAADAARLLREARIVSTLSDPHIVAVHDADERDGIAFVAMEVVDGAPLTRHVRPGGLPLDELLRIGIDVAAGLARAHAAGVVHRDLKPANVMITATGTAKILDFGLATRTDGQSGDTSTFAALSGPGVVAGTVGYMSPEQAEGRAVDARSDIFAFGVLLYELASGQRPFDRDSAAGTLAAILRDPPPPLVEVRRDAPAQLARIVDRCLRKERERRFQSTADLRAALEDLRDAVGQAAAVPVAEPAHQRRRAPASRWVGLARATGLVAAGAAAATGVGLLRTDGPSPMVGTALTQLTFDGGISGNPALSTDGSLLAFASDRSGAENLDIWVQPVAGGAPVQVTREPTDERTPVFSPDGGRIFFRSERDGGGIYSVPALGGEPRLVVTGGLSPRVSPDGRQLAYWTGSFIGFTRTPGGYRTFIVDAAGGTPREIGGFTNSRFPVWSPDGRSLIVSATQADEPEARTYDWWVVPLDGRPPIATGARALLGAGASDVGAQGSPSTWTGDRVLTSWHGDLAAVTLDRSGRATSVEQLTFGPGTEYEPMATIDGTVAFADAVARLSIWSLPVDTDRARVLGDFRRLTEGTGPFVRASMSSDEGWATFFGPGPTIQLQNLATGQVRDLGPAPGATFGPVLSPDGQRVAYPTRSGEIRSAAVKGGAPDVLCRGCQEAGDWTRDGRWLTIVRDIGGRTALGLADASNGDVIVLATSGDERALNRPTLSADNRWLAFRAISGRQQVYVAPFTGPRPIPVADWTAVGGAESDVRPIGWSPSGRMLYLFSARDGFRCLYAQPMDPATGRPDGEARLVRHLHNVRAPGGGGGSVASTGAGNAVGRHQILFDFPDQIVNVWTIRLGPPPSATPPTTAP